MKIGKSRKVALLFTLFSIAMAGIASGGAYEFLLDQISKSDYQAYVENLVGFGSRYLYSPGNTSAKDYIYNQFSANGLIVSYDYFYYNGNYYQNVVGTLPGTAHPEEIFILGAHFDSLPAGTDSPGADDNASGVAAILEIASVLSNYRFGCTIQFVAFNAEEQGLRGSKAYADKSKANGDNIKGMINFDMIAYTGNNPLGDIEIMGDAWLVDAFSANSFAYVPSLFTESHYGNVYGSDNYYFHSTKYDGSASILLVEDTPNEIWGGSNPYYHKSTDLPENLDYDFAWNVAKAATATMADISGIQSAKGDVNGDGFINLQDAILALRILSNFQSIDVQRDADVNGDGLIGIEEVVFILQEVGAVQ